MENLEIHSFRSRQQSNEHLQEEIDALTQQMGVLKTLLSDKSKHNDALQAKHLREQKRAETLMRLVKEKEARIARLEEFDALCRTLTQQKHDLEQELEHERKRNQPLYEEKVDLAQNLAMAQRAQHLLEEEAKAHRQELATRDQTIQQLQRELAEERRAFQQTLEHLKEAVGQLDAVTQRLNIVQQEKDEQATEQQALLLQFDRLRAASEQTQASAAETRFQLSQTIEAIDQLRQEKTQFEEAAILEQRKLQDHLRQRNARIDILEAEVETFKAALEHQQQAVQTKEQAMLEVVEAAEQDVHRHKEHIAVLGAQIEELENELAYAKQKTTQTQDELAHVLEERQHALDQILQLQKETEERAQRQSEQMQQRNSKIDGLTHQVAILENERVRLDDTIARGRKAQEEREAELKVAQQHLAKKVKEAAAINEQLEEANQQNNRVQREVKDLRSQVEGLKNELQQFQRREKQLEDQLLEQQHAGDLKVAKWEKEYWRVHEQWQLSEAKILQLKTLEDKYSQLHALLTDIGRFAEPKAAPILHEHLSEPVQEPLKEPEKPLDPDLFNAPQQPMPRIRQNLFD